MRSKFGAESANRICRSLEAYNYPAYFPQALSNPQETWCYPEAAQLAIAAYSGE